MAASAASDKQNFYMRRRVSFTVEAQERGEVKVEYVPSNDNKADILTKVLGVKMFCRLRDALMNVSESVKFVAAHVVSKIVKLRASK